MQDVPPSDKHAARSTRHAALFYPAWEILPQEARLPHVDVISERLETLVALTQYATRVRDHISRSTHQVPLIVTNVVALLQRTFAPKMLALRTRTLRRGEGIDPLDLVEWLEEQGYEPEAKVSSKGDISLRGGILDVFPLTSPWPVRLEFFGNELESIRYFDPLTQMSKEEVTSATLPPAGELGILKKVSGVRCQVPGDPRASELTPDTSDVTPSLATLLDYLPPKTIWLLCEPDLIQQQANSYADSVSEADPFFIGWQEFVSALDAKGMTRLEVSEHDAKRLEYGDSSPLFIPEAGFNAENAAVSDETQGRVEPKHSNNLHFQSLDAFRPIVGRAPEPPVAEAQRREFFAQLHRWLRQGYAVHVFCNNEGERQRFVEIGEEYGFGRVLNATTEGHPPPGPSVVSQGGRKSQPAPKASSKRRKLSPSPGGEGWGEGERESDFMAKAVTGDSQLRIHRGALTRGFLYDEGRTVVVTDAEIFGRYKVQRPRRLKYPRALATRSALDIDFTELEEGDYVVHLQHGIGRYVGLQTMPLGAGRKRRDGSIATEASEMLAARGQECLVIEYAPSDLDQPPPKLYVPVTEAHLVSKYVGAGKARPPLNTLGGTRWARTKAQAEKAVHDLAAELLTIQAARETQSGHAFAPDAPWQREFESAFIYEETTDQMRAIVEAKADMESPKPMDRLICGDVGFGKTEVAIRAAFKAVLDGKQVAVLVPTTVLAQQHFNTFRERMADYPVRIELLSRFRTHREQQRVTQDLAAGAVDIVIGTHRLIQDDVVFKDLGLVVIDEEQRFGVLHKEKFKLLRKLVDVLTLSATPIPRTLYLALTGARDMSTIQTPPQDRLPVETIVTQYDERLIRDAIQREMNRGGQVFFLHNRVMTIDTMAQRLRALLPHARIAVGHGQMHNDDLEEVMTKFVNGEADVLLSTTIIESGLDIPNANTIIIDRADRFGLSDLYQLRGRVGRYKHQAFAYLLLPRHAGLLADARKRISAIRQYSTLGSGFKIAMRDLEIRGAGNLLGAEQSGHITAVGFELYCQLLKQSVSALKGEKVKPRVEVEVRLDFLALGPVEESRPRSKTRSPQPSLEDIEVPRETAVYVSDDETVSKSQLANCKSQIARAAAYLPLNYIPDGPQRIEMYRKLAQVTERGALASLKGEMRDRFGAVPVAVELLLQVSELKLIASQKNITVVETKEDKLMLTRNNDYITLDGKFPRLTKSTPKGRLSEIKKMLLAL